MKDVIAKILDGLIELFRHNYKRPRLWVGLAAVVVVFILVFPYIDSNFFYYSRMEKRIQILEQLISLDEEAIEHNQAYKDEYESILQEVEQQRDRSVNSVMNRAIDTIGSIVTAGMAQGNKYLKFLSGAALSLLILIWIPFMNTFNRRSDKIIAFIIVLFIAGLLGWIASILPILFSPWVNYIGAPVVQIVLLVAAVTKGDKKEN